MIRFANWYFLLLIPIIIFLFWVFKEKRALNFSSVRLLRQNVHGKTCKHKIGKIFVLAGLVLLLIALARPQATIGNELVRMRGIDIALVLDVSDSMESTDFEPNRLEVARKTVDDFIAARDNDKISLIIFAGTAYTRIPLTMDHNVVRESLATVTVQSVNQGGTAIGTAIAVGINRLEKSATESKIMILVTDGENNNLDVDPLAIGKYAQELGLRIYTIGVGSDMTIVVSENLGPRQYASTLDEELLIEIADLTGGQYFRARDSEALAQIFASIDQLEKTEFEDDNFKEYTELAFPIIKVALLLLLAGLILDRYYFVQIP